MAWNKNGKQSLFYTAALLVTMLIIGNTMNTINLHKILNYIEEKGIDYEDFREMKLSDEMIEKVKNGMKGDLPAGGNLSGISEEQLDKLTLYMLINRYNLKKITEIDRKNEEFLLKGLARNSSFLELRSYYSSIFKDVECFPVAKDKKGKNVVSFDDSWNAPRSYGGNRHHEGTDLMPEKNRRGYYHVISMTEGTVEKIGWLEQGGYRVGIRSKNGVYYYYAHLYSYAPGLKEGKTITKGEFLGLMGDSGYGPEGTVGKFDVHLHVGIYVPSPSGDLSVNPYSILKYLEEEEN